MACLICSSDRSKTIFTEDGVDIKRCLRCGHVYSSFVRPQFYDGYYPSNIADDDHFWWQKAHYLMYYVFIRKFLFNRSGKLLDFACGLGYFLQEVGNLLKNNNNWELHGIEISSTAVEFAQKKLKLKNIVQGSVEKVSYPQKYFDLITMWDVVEHLSSPRSTLQHLKEILSEKGILFIATPNINIQLPKAIIKKICLRGKPGHYLEARDHLHNYSPRSLSRLLKESGFKKIRFIQLPPIQSVSGSKSRWLSFIKNLWFVFSVILFYLSAKKININNLFVIAQKN